MTDDKLLTFGSGFYLSSVPKCNTRPCLLWIQERRGEYICPTVQKRGTAQMLSQGVHCVYMDRAKENGRVSRPEAAEESVKVLA